MRNFDYNIISNGLLTNEIVNLIAAIHEYKGKQDLFIEAKPDILSSLLNIAKVQSTEASNKIEGIYTTDKRLNDIVNNKAEPKTRNEKEIAGYRDVLATIHESYDYIKPRTNNILQFHRDLYIYSATSFGGQYKNSNNIIEEIDIFGNTKIRFKPVSAFETPTVLKTLCDTFIEEIKKNNIDPLLLIPVFILDFLCIHPFNDGNGRMSRLLTLLLLYRSGYIVGKYISIEMIIEKTKETYYEVLKLSSENWHENNGDYKPFIEYYLGIILSAYKEFSSRVEYLTTKKISKKERVVTVIKNYTGKFTKKEIMNICPDISESLIEKVLTELLSENVITKIGNRRYTSYILSS